MKTPSIRRRAQRGVATIELAILLPLLVLLLTVPIVFARYFWYYTATQKAAQDAARYLSAVRQTEIRSPTLVVHATDVARDIVAAELSNVKVVGRPTVEVMCDGGECYGNGVIPETVRVRIRMQYHDDIFHAVNFGDYGITITADATMRYAGY